VPYLSRIYLNPLRSGTQRLFTNPQRLHAAVLGGLPGQPVTERVLWRIEQDAHRLTVLVLTRSRPSWEHLVEQAGWPGAATPQAEVRDYQPMLDRLATGQTYTFRVRANPAHSLPPAGPGRRGRRVAHRTVAQQTSWLTGHAPTWGMTVPDGTAGQPDLRVVDRQTLRFAKSDGTTRRQVTVQTATFEGSATVTDPTRLAGCLLDGVGPARAYGCGLLTLAPRWET